MVVRYAALGTGVIVGSAVFHAILFNACVTCLSAVVARLRLAVARLCLGLLSTFVGAGGGCSRSGTALKEVASRALATLFCFNIL